MLKQMKMLITGATGLVGRQVAERLVRRGHQVVAASRNPDSTWRHIGVPHTSVAWRPGTAPDEATIASLQGVNAVVHLVGENVADGRWTPERKERLLASRAQGTAHLWTMLESLDELPSVVISASGVGYYGDRNNEILSEDDAPGSGFLAEVCQQWEHALFHTQIKNHEQVRKVAMRIGVVLDPDGGALKKMLPALENYVGGPLSLGQQWMSWIHIEDLLSMIEHVLITPSVRGPINAVSDECVTNAGFTRTLARVLGKPAVCPVPAFALHLALGEMKEMLLASQRTSNVKVRRTGFALRYPGLREALEHVLHHPAQGLHRLRSSQWVPKPINALWDFFSEATNLEKITPPFLGFCVQGMSTPTIGKGTFIDYRLSLHGLPVTWRSHIAQWEPGVSFVDEQVKGPFHTWHHTHRFESFAGGTIIHDEVLYRAPCGPVGRLLELAFIRRDIEAIFAYRRQVIQTQFAEVTHAA